MKLCRYFLRDVCQLEIRIIQSTLLIIYNSILYSEKYWWEKNTGKFSYLRYLGEHLSEWSTKLINTDIEYSINLREKTLAIGHQFAKFINFVSHHNVFHYTVYTYWGLIPAIYPQTWFSLTVSNVFNTPNSKM